MAKHPVKQSFAHRMIALIKRNPFTSIASLVTIFVGIPGAVAGYNYGLGLVDPVIPALHYWVRNHAGEQIAPLMKLTQQHAIDLDYLILKEQHKALSEAKDDLRRDPNSTSAPVVIEKLQKSIDTRSKRLDDALKTK